MIQRHFYNKIKTNYPLELEGNTSFVLPKTGVSVQIHHNTNYKITPFSLEIKFFDKDLVCFYKEDSFSGGEYSYNISWSDNERFFAVTYISQWYEDLYFLDIKEKRIIHSITGKCQQDGSRAVFFLGNLAIILPTLNYEGGVSDIKIFNCETKETQIILNHENAKLYNRIIEDYDFSDKAQLLFLRSNIYKQENIHSPEVIENSPTLYPAFENLFNIRQNNVVITIVDLKHLIDKRSLKILQNTYFDIPVSKLFVEQIKENTFEINFIGSTKSIEYNITLQEFSEINEIVVLDEITEGYCIDLHTVSSSINENGSFNTKRTQIGQLLYKLKYQNDKSGLNKIVEELNKLVSKIKTKLCLGNIRTRNIDVIIPIPPTNENRAFQPVYEISKALSNTSNIPFNGAYLTKKHKTEIKGVEDIDERQKILEHSFEVVGEEYKGKTILLLDDIFRSGATLKSAMKVLKEKGKVRDIVVITVTKTRTKR